MKVSKYIGILLLGGMWISCGSNSLSAPDLVKWMENEDHHLRQTKTENNVTYILQYKTMDYVLAARGREVLADSSNTESLHRDAEKSLLFDLYITCAGGKQSPLQYRVSSAQEVNERYMYYHFRFIDDVYLEADGQKIKPLYCLADKGSGLNNTLAFSIGFERTDAAGKDFRLVVNDTRLGTGTVKFLFTDKDIRNIPSLKTDA